MTDVDRRKQFETVCEVIYEPLQRYLRRRTTIDDAEEVFDDVLLILWQKLPIFPSDEYLPWCYGVARRALANRRRANARRQGLLARLSSQPLPVPVDEVGLDDYPALAKAFGHIPEMDREVLRLWAWEGLEAREIAAVFGISPNAASLRLTKAKKKLARQMNGQDGGYGGHREIEDTGERRS